MKTKPIVHEQYNFIISWIETIQFISNLRDGKPYGS